MSYFKEIRAVNSATHPKTDPAPNEWGMVEFDTGKIFFATNGVWVETNSGGGGGGGGTVTSVSVTAANGVSGSVLNPSTTPAITLSLGNITPTSVAASGTVTGSNLSGTNTGDQTITLTGDVTGSGTGSFAATIANDAVTFGKFQNITTNRLLGRATAGSGDMEEITLGTGLSYTGTTLNVTTADTGITELTGGVTAGPGSGSQVATVVTNANLTGPITSVGNATTITNDSVTTAKIADDNVTYAKIQNVTTNRLLGRATAGSGNTEEITLGTNLSFTGTTLNAADTTGITQLTGDVTAGPGSGSQVATIPNDTVTYAKIQNVTSSRLLGRATAGSGDTEEITLGTGLSFNGTSLDSTSSASPTEILKSFNQAFSGDVAETTVGTVSIPAGMLSTIHGIKWEFAVTGNSGDAGQKDFTVRVKYGGTTFQTLLFSVSGANSATRIGSGFFLNNASVSAQDVVTSEQSGSATLSGGNGIPVHSTRTIDSSTAQNFLFTFEESSPGGVTLSANIIYFKAEYIFAV